jgi:hypothetical protein
MAAKGKHPTSAKGKYSSKRAAQLSNRVEAKKRKGSGRASTDRRTTLRVPLALEAEISRTAKELEVSENEALIRLAQLGAMTAKRKRDVRRVIGRRHSAVSGAGAGAHLPTFPSPEEMQEAILVDRG